MWDSTIPLYIVAGSACHPLACRVLYGSPTWGTAPVIWCRLNVDGRAGMWQPWRQLDYDRGIKYVYDMWESTFTLCLVAGSVHNTLQLRVLYDAPTWGVTHVIPCILNDDARSGMWQLWRPSMSNRIILYI